MDKKLIIFDADSIVFLVAYKFRNKNVKALVTMNLNKFISDIITSAGATHYIGFFGSKKDGAKPNFRFGLDPNYKLNRPETPEWIVKWRPIIQKVMEDKWGFIGVEGMEADDAVSIAAKYFSSITGPDGTKDYGEIIVAACDKDLKQIPNIIYYNYEKHTSEFINSFDAAKHLGIQILMGDSTDNIKGLDGVGPKNASKLLSECVTIPQIKWTVARTYAEREEELRTKAEATVFNDIKTELLSDTSIDTSTFSEKQLERLVRIRSKQKLANTVLDSMPGGWKKYLKTQIALLTLLSDVPDWFTLPEPIESKLVPSLAQEATDTISIDPNTTESKPKPAHDNFLYL